MDKTLLDLIDVASLMVIDNSFSIRWFGLDVDGIDYDCEGDPDNEIILNIEHMDGFDHYDWSFTSNELRDAVYDSNNRSWTVYMGKESIEINLYKLTPITPETKL